MALGVRAEKSYALGTAEETDEALGVTVWLSQTTAPDWLADARAEAERGLSLEAELETEEDHETRRALLRSLHREIVFAVCFTESFLLEFLRDYVFLHRPGKGDWNALVAFVVRDKNAQGIPLWEREGIRRRWYRTVRELQDEGRLRDEPAFEGQEWQEFQAELAPFRNGIVHARISRPTRGGSEASAEPSPRMLYDKGAGWATGVAEGLARTLHRLDPFDMEAPEYLA